MEIILRLTDGDDAWLLEWSPARRAPVTMGMSDDEFYEHYKAKYGATGLPIRMRRVKKTGASVYGKTADEVIADNRAGYNDACATRDEIIEWYCRKKQPPGPGGGTA